MKEGETASEISSMGASSSTSKTLSAISENAQIAIVSEDGLIAMDTSKFRFTDQFINRKKILFHLMTF